MARVKEQHTSGEFSGIKILPVSSLEPSVESRGAAASGLQSITICGNQPTALKWVKQKISIICKKTKNSKCWIKTLQRANLVLIKTKQTQ